jgi:hypothetical protein
MLAHELAHLVAGDPDRPPPATLDEYLREERDADLKAAERFSGDVMCAAVMRAYQKSIELGFESNTNIPSEVPGPLSGVDQERHRKNQRQPSPRTRLSESPGP